MQILFTTFLSFSFLIVVGYINFSVNNQVLQTKLKIKFQHFSKQLLHIDLVTTIIMKVCSICGWGKDFILKPKVLGMNFLVTCSKKTTISCNMMSLWTKVTCWNPCVRGWTFHNYNQFHLHVSETFRIGLWIMWWRFII